MKVKGHSQDHKFKSFGKRNVPLKYESPISNGSKVMANI